MAPRISLRNRSLLSDAEVWITKSSLRDIYMKLHVNDHPQTEVSVGIFPHVLSLKRRLWPLFFFPSVMQVIDYDYSEILKKSIDWKFSRERSSSKGPTRRSLGPSGVEREKTASLWTGSLVEDGVKRKPEERGLNNILPSANLLSASFFSARPFTGEKTAAWHLRLLAVEVASKNYFIWIVPIAFHP